MNYFYMFLIVVFFISCNKKEEIKPVNKIDHTLLCTSVDSNLVKKIHKQINLYMDSSSIRIVCDIKNLSKESIFIPISEWYYFANDPKISFNNNYGINGFINVVKFDIPSPIFPDNHCIDGRIISVADYYPRFIRIKPKQNTTIVINFPRYYKQREIVNLLKDTIKYTLTVEFPALTDIVFNSIFSSSSSNVLDGNFAITLPSTETITFKHWITNNSEIYRNDDNQFLMNSTKFNKITLKKEFKLNNIKAYTR